MEAIQQDNTFVTSFQIDYKSLEKDKIRVKVWLSSWFLKNNEKNKNNYKLLLTLKQTAVSSDVLLTHPSRSIISPDFLLCSGKDTFPVS